MSTAFASVAARYWGGQLRTTGSVLDVTLAPAEALFRAAVALRSRAYARGTLSVERADIPVISVGNIAVGGAGKTPFTQWIAKWLRARGERPAIVHGGYALDEPELHRRWSPDIPVIVERDRVRAAQAAAAEGATVVVLDDAFQHRRLHRDLDIVLVSVDRFDRPIRMLPRGPWREPLGALRRADIVVTTRKTAAPTAADDVAALLATYARRPVVQLYFRPDRWLHRGAAALAPVGAALLVCAIADPHTCAASARAAGADPADCMSFPDHHAYSADDAAAIQRRAGSHPIVTTEKDWTKLDALLPSEQVWILAQSVVLEQGAEPLTAALNEVVA